MFAPPPPPSPEELRSLTREQLTERGNAALFSSSDWTLAGVVFAALASRVVPPAHRFTPLIVAAAMSIPLDYARGRERAQPYFERLAALDAEAVAHAATSTAASTQPPSNRAAS